MTRAGLWRATLAFTDTSSALTTMRGIVRRFTAACNANGLPLSNPHIESITLTTDDLPHTLSPIHEMAVDASCKLHTHYLQRTLDTIYLRKPYDPVEPNNINMPPTLADKAVGLPPPPSMPKPSKNG